MEFSDEKRRQERRLIEQRLRRTKIECGILGIITFALACALALLAIQNNQRQEAAVGASARIQTFQSDEKVRQTFQSDEEALDLLILVNKDHPLPEGYEVELHWLQNRTCAVAEEMYDALQEMLTEGAKAGGEFVVASGYRSREYQQTLLDEDIEAAMESEGLTWQQAYDQETQETMPPGCSEHETGLAVDLVSLDYQVLDHAQETTWENQWLRENCAGFGFILRYPEGMEDITGISYEPWHFRYVGQEAAEEITRQGITLEEYLGEV